MIMQRKILAGLCAALSLFFMSLPSAKADQGCNLAHGVKHVLYLQFDNVHLDRDSANVPSDLEQIPSLNNFLKGEGVLLANHHAPLLAKTSVDFISSMTGVYGEKFGFAVGNTFGFFNQAGTPALTPSFAYWTDIVNEGTATAPVLVPQMVDPRGKIHPAPWVPFTRAGCDVGAFSIVNIELENTTTDIDNVFGANSPEHAENLANPALAAADYEGIAVHCAISSQRCRSQNARPDVLTDEPGGYYGFSALFGNKNVAPAITAGQSFVSDLDGAPITDSSKPPNNGFPGFNPTPAQSLGYAAQMFEAGVPVVYLYMEDAHDNHAYPGAPPYPDAAFGPGEANYVYQLKAYDAAFKKFFARLAADGITKDNTLFIATADEGDHFAGSTSAATPAGCDGVHVPCTYPVGAKGEVSGDLSRIFATEFGNTTPFAMRNDDVASIYIVGKPSPFDSQITRPFERDAGQLVGFDTITGGDKTITQAMADPAEMALLHMISHDPARTPTLELFGSTDFTLTHSGQTQPLCTPASDAKSCFTQSRNAAWNHGDYQRDIVRTWLGVVGPNVRNLGLQPSLFTDHTDIRPTLLSLTGLKDDYAHDGRVLFEILSDAALPKPAVGQRSTLERLAQAYEEINAPTGEFGIKTLTGISTIALRSDDWTYGQLEAKIVELTAKRNTIAGNMISMLENAVFEGRPIDEDVAERLIDRAHALLRELDRERGSSGDGGHNSGGWPRGGFDVAN